MKRYLLLLCCFISVAAMSQNAYFVDKKGAKTIVRDDAIDIILIDKRVSYKLPGKTWEKYITYKDLDYAVVGPYVFRSVRLNGKKKDEGFFVIAESEDKKLLGYAITITTTSSSGRMSSTRTEYRLVVTDNKYMILGESKFSSNSGDEARFKAAALLREHFSGCPEITGKLSAANEEVSEILDSPEYTNCKK